uniref:Ig-like domain-containing protein n=1 Tax=Astatotilapia calliptera TaxID=8154 RepID=A0A3P8PLW6_ASTCA
MLLENISAYCICTKTLMLLALEIMQYVWSCNDLCSTLCLTGVSSGTFVVTQSPDHVFVRKGETVNITCCWKGKFERIRVNWLKNQTEIRSDYFINQPNVFLKKEEKKCYFLKISNIRPDDSGTYICKVTVEIPSLTEAKGNGTVITVKTGNDTGNNSQNSLYPGNPTNVIISLAVVVPLLLVTLVCYCTLRRKQGTNFK